MAEQAGPFCQLLRSCLETHASTTTHSSLAARLEPRLAPILRCWSSRHSILPSILVLSWPSSRSGIANLTEEKPRQLHRTSGQASCSSLPSSYSGPVTICSETHLTKPASSSAFSASTTTLAPATSSQLLAALFEQRHTASYLLDPNNIYASCCLTRFDPSRHGFGSSLCCPIKTPESFPYFCRRLSHRRSISTCRPGPYVSVVAILLPGSA